MSTLQYNNCIYASAFTKLIGPQVYRKSYNDDKSDFLSILKKRYNSENHMSSISINMYVDKASKSFKKHFSSEMIENMAKIKMFTNIIEDDERVYSDSFLHKINELLIKLGDNQPEIFPSLSGEIELDFGNIKNRVTVIIKPDGNMNIIKCENGNKPYYLEKSAKYDDDYLQRIVNGNGCYL